MPYERRRKSFGAQICTEDALYTNKTSGKHRMKKSCFPKILTPKNEIFVISFFNRPENFKGRLESYAK